MRHSGKIIFQTNITLQIDPPNLSIPRKMQWSHNVSTDNQSLVRHRVQPPLACIPTLETFCLTKNYIL